MNAIAAVAPGALVTDNSGAFTLALWIGVGLMGAAVVLVIVLSLAMRGDGAGGGAVIPGFVLFAAGIFVLMSGAAGADSGD